MKTQTRIYINKNKQLITASIKRDIAVLTVHSQSLTFTLTLLSRPRQKPSHLKSLGATSFPARYWSVDLNACGAAVASYCRVDFAVLVWQWSIGRVNSIEEVGPQRVCLLLEKRLSPRLPVRRNIWVAQRPPMIQRAFRKKTLEAVFYSSSKLRTAA